MYKVDLNSDIGESFGNYKLGFDEEIVPHITSANIACGWHAGDPTVMAHTVDIAIQNNTAIGAHPGLPDLMGFGRRRMEVSPQEVKSYVKYQLGALTAFAEAKGNKIQHVKPHGGLYNMAAEDRDLARAIAKGIYEVDKDIILVGLANSELIHMGKEVGVRVANEVFADRAYNPDGTLVSRKREGAVIHDPDLAFSRIAKMVLDGKVEAINGEEIEITADTICVHGDNPEAVEFVSKINTKLKAEGIEVAPISQIVA
ncbi:LamB/YcsF family protein [Acetohalobium arabaticum]|uniref:5-oxoprolinase subunit A n=1 Tax=Acetohalobium arabaticum (strain ATCC 49924 / DSM 5501 / Z-7288) TaxID=574087 RepID=D9QUX4_ACEAZ|nr:5-oxoprolinase subunit PxpA [Acetohalobium arabaticum]ADL12033.1 LamB/YcsF family protein [Acetohalobium arabaticum DSM 5501]